MLFECSKLGLRGTGGLLERVVSELIEVEEIEQGRGKKVSQLEQMLTDLATKESFVALREQATSAERVLRERREFFAIPSQRPLFRSFRSVVLATHDSRLSRTIRDGRK